MSGKILKIYTDGSCLVHIRDGETENTNKSSPGGWCFCALISNRFDLISSGGCNSTTNNRMELTAVIEALKEFIDNSELLCIEFFSDSQLTINCASRIWKRKMNSDLWEEYDRLAKMYKNISWTWVKAHNNNRYNDIVDIISREEAKKIYMKN